MPLFVRVPRYNLCIVWTSSTQLQTKIIISTDLLCTKFNVFSNPCFHMCCTDVQLLPDADENRSKHVKNCNILCKKYNFNRSAFVDLMCEVFMITSLPDKMFKLKIYCFEKYSCGMGSHHLSCYACAICCAAANVIHLSCRQ